MAIDLDEAKRIAFGFSAISLRRNLSIEPSSLPEPGAYGFDPAGWATFAVIDSTRIGSCEYIAVNLETGEVKSLAMLGE